MHVLLVWLAGDFERAVPDFLLNLFGGAVILSCKTPAVLSYMLS